MKKQFIRGFIVGAIIFGSLTAFAATSYEAVTASFPILITGKTWSSDKPVVVIVGSTYLPLKAIGDVLNVKVNWNNDLRQVEIGDDFSVEETVESKSETIGQKNAIKKAESYLSFMAFSYDGLVSQLEFEGFSREEAIYGVDHCGANWNEQAVKKAKSYLSFSSFSRKSLIEQLEFGGFTHEQAIYGVEGAGY